MDALSRQQFHKHKVYRWIALLAKLISVVIFTFVFARFTNTLLIPFLGTQSLGTFLTTLFSLLVYYSVIFILNRCFNFKSKTNLKNAIIIYAIVIFLMLVFETLTSGMLQNALYSFLYPEGLIDGTIYPSANTVTYLGEYVILGLFVHIFYSFLTGIIIFYLYKNVLNRKDVIGEA